MYIKGLLLNSFRNYAELEFFPSPLLNIICGDNAQGKTNLLEAMFLSTFARSHRTSRDSELIMQGSDGASVSVAFVDAAEDNRRIDTMLYSRGKKEMRVDGARVERIGDAVGVMNTIMFSPESLYLVKGAPAERRRFLDMGMCQLGRSHFFRLQKYNYALRQRNALLKIGQNTNISAQLAPWDSILSTCAAQIMLSRMRYVDRITPYVQNKYSVLSGGAEEFALEYVPSIMPLCALREADADKLAVAIQERYSETLSDDIRRGITSYGTHKDDLMLRTDGRETRVFASQGQQRTAALALKLSEIELICELAGTTPVVLLDDVLSELDDARSRALLDCVSNCQCFLTTANMSLVRNLLRDEAMVYNCTAGKLTRQCTL